MVGNAFDAILEQRRTEIDQQAEAKIEEPEIGEHLFAVNRSEGLDGFQFYQNRPLHDEICTEALFKMEGIIDNWDRNLSFDRQLAFLQLVGQNTFVDRFKQPRAETAVNMDRGVDNLSRNLIQIIWG